jgi:hypothetical protein
VSSKSPAPITFDLVLNPQTPMFELSPINKTSTPATLAPFSPVNTSAEVCQPCLAAAQAKAASLSAPAPPPPPQRPIKPCDIGNLRIEVREPNSTAGGEDSIIFETIKACSGIATQRPRDLTVIGNEPEHIKALLSTNDLVIEVIAPPSDKGTAKGVIGPAKTNTQAGVMIAQHKASAKASDGVTTLIVGARWDAQCGEARHAATTLTEGLNPAITKGPNFSQTITSKSKADIGNLWDFVTSGLNPRVLGKEYRIDATSCGVTAKGPATTNLRASVTAFPPGVTGLKLGFEGFSWSFGWTRADEFVDNANAYAQENKAILDASSTAQLETRLDKAEANGARLRQQKPKRGGARGRQVARLKSNQQEINRVKNLLEAKEVSAATDDSGLSLNIILFDEEIDPFETYNKVKNSIATVKRAEKTIRGIMDVLVFLTRYSPSLVTPLAELSIAVLGLELFVGFKLNSDQKYRGERWRGLPNCFDIEFNAKFLEIGGSFGAIVGKRVLGTGASVEILFAPIASVSIGAEYSSPTYFNSQMPGWRETSLQLVGDFRGTASFQGKVSILYFNLAYVSADVNASGRLHTSGTLREVMTTNQKIPLYLTTDPAGGMIEARLGWMGKKYPYQVWEGQTTDLTY